MRLPKPLENAYDWVRYDLLGRSDRRLLIAGGIAGAALLALALVILLPGDDQPTDRETRVVTVSVQSDDPQEAPVGTLGFPLVATRNTTRVSGPDPIADAAATALATHPPAPGADPIEAAVMVGEGDWQAGIAASVLAGPPLRAPLLVGQKGEVPESTALALAQLEPRGGTSPADVAVYLVGEAGAPSGLKTEQLKGSAPAELAGAIDELRQRLLKTEPAHIVVASLDRPAYAMPAASWAARSGDPVLFSGRNEVPAATLEALRRHSGVPVYLLGPESVISEQARQEIERVAAGTQRIGAEGPVANSIAFARFSDSSFGWDINDPGHGMVLASGSRPLDAAAAATLSASGKWGPLLVTDTPDALPPDLRGFLLDLKPGYEDDPTRAVYNHIWLIGDASAIGASVQAELDELAELVQVGAGSGQAGAGPAQPEAEPQQQQDTDQGGAGQGADQGSAGQGAGSP
ncbi:MAG: hypothetical protein ACRDL6_13105 [Solirubrobacterales bacterium]